MLGWGEFELEVMRDRNDNVVIVCSIENIDPMGVHTGDSLTVAPQQSLTDAAYQRLRDQAITVIRAVGVETGGSNVQFAVDPRSGEIVVIEMNPRVSRSSALASKATGFPIAKIAARLAVGYALEEIANDITRATPASFEPTIDYVVVKWPRFAFEKFAGRRRRADDAHEVGRRGDGDRAHVRAGVPQGDALARARRRGRTLDVAAARGCSSASRSRARTATTSCSRRCAAARASSELHERTSIDPWFLRELARDRGATRDAAFAGVRTFKSVDTCAAEFAATTPYYYSSWERPGGGRRREVVRGERPSVVILGSGPNRIGQGIEFDYCCVHAAMTVRASGRDAVMINCNPETVSTDYDTSDRLYFEPLTLEDVLAVIELERPEGVIVQFGGQTPLRLAAGLERAGVRLLGHERRRDRHRRGPRPLRRAARPPRLPGAALRDRAHRRGGARRRAAASASRCWCARATCSAGARWRSSTRREDLERLPASATRRAADGREIFLDHFLENAIEVDVDALCDGREVWIGGIMQHVEEAGIHSGDSACVLPPHSLGDGDARADPRADARHRARARRRRPAQRAVRGRAAAERAVRDRGQPARVAHRAVRLQGDRPAAREARLPDHARRADRRARPARRPDERRATSRSRRRCCRSTASSARTRCSGPEMRSTGEVMGIAARLPDRVREGAGGGRRGAARRRHRLHHGHRHRQGRRRRASRRSCTTSASRSSRRAAPRRRSRAWACRCARCARSARARRTSSTRSPRGEVDLVINTPTGSGARSDGWEIRRAAVARGIPCITTLSGGQAAARAIRAARDGEPTVVSLQEVHARDDARRSVAARAVRLERRARRALRRARRSRDELARAQPGQFYMLAAAERWGGGEGERPFLGARDLGACAPRDDGARRVPARGRRARARSGCASSRPGEELRLVGPLGRGFSRRRRDALLVGGGIGIAPLLARPGALGRRARCSASATPSTPQAAALFARRR